MEKSKKKLPHLLFLLGTWAMLIFWPMVKKEDAPSPLKATGIDIFNTITGRYNGDALTIAANTILVNYIVISVIVLTSVYFIRGYKKMKTGATIIIISWIVTLTNFIWIWVAYKYIDYDKNLSGSFFLIPLSLLVFSLTLPSKNEELFDDV